MKEKRSVRLAGRPLEHSLHVCAFFNTREEEYQLLLPFIKEGFEENQAVLELRDNGRGFIVRGNWIEFARQGHLGLIGSFERAEAVGGKVTVTSTPGKGTQIQVRVPLDKTLS